MDFFDILILIDLIQFGSSLFFLYVYLTLAMCPTNNTMWILQIKTKKEDENMDFLEQEVYMKNTIVQIFSFSCVCTMFLFIIKIDKF